MSRKGVDEPMPHERLARAMNARRLDLRLRWNEVAALAKVSTVGLRALRRGDYQPSPLAMKGLEAALQWESGSVEVVLAGGDPTPIPQPEPETPLTMEQLRAMVKASAAETERLRANQQAIIERMRDILGPEAVAGLQSSLGEESHRNAS